MQAQEWLEKNYPNKETITKIKRKHFTEIEGELVIANFPNLQKINVSSVRKGKLTKLKIINCPQLSKLNCQNNQLEELWCSNNCLTKLNVNNCQQLKEIRCWNNQLTTLNLSNLKQLEILHCYYNYLTQIVYPTNPKKITKLDIRNNNLKPSDLTVFSSLRNLTHLYIGNTDKNKINQNIYNRVVGSLEPLKGLTKLRELTISNTDIDSGLEYLSDSIIELECSNQARPQSQVSKISEQLAPYNGDIKTWVGWNKVGFDNQEKWITAGLKINEWGLANYLEQKDCNPAETEKIKALAKKCVQKWVEEKYPDKWHRELYLNQLDLEGKLDLKDFTRLQRIYISHLVDESKLEFKNLEYVVEVLTSEKGEWEEIEKGTAAIIKLIYAKTFKEYLDKNFPQEIRKDTLKVDLTNLDLAGDLDLGDFTCEYLGVYLTGNTKLEEIKNKPKHARICLDAQDWLTNKYPQYKEVTLTGLEDFKELLIIDDFPKLEKINVGGSKLTQLHLNNCPNLIELNCQYNKLTELTITNCPNLRKIHAKSNQLTNQDLINIYGLCSQCLQPNTSENWCHPCAEKEWSQLEGQELVEKFIQQQKESKGYENLKWIPYEQFTNIEHLADGGFSKIYKAKWGKEKDFSGNDAIIVLKSLTNSKNITLDFLQEIANTKLVDNFMGNVVFCYGISQDPQTKDYIMVMWYMKEGNLRQVLQNKANKLSLKIKLGQILGTANGLRDIHQQNLVHQDFHSGNILYDSSWVEREKEQTKITDLGLSKLVNSQKQEGQIFGVLPYVAPEVLQGKPYTQKSDIYSFGIVAYEYLANAYPYPKMGELELSLKVCNEKKPLRPNIDIISIPQELKDLIKRCWDADPEKRPSVNELANIISGWYYDWQYQEIEQEYNTFSQRPYQIHPNAILTSKMINTKQITQQLEKLKVSKQFGSKNLELDINDFNLDELNLQENPQEESSQRSSSTQRESSTQTQIEILPKK